MFNFDLYPEDTTITTITAAIKSMRNETQTIAFFFLLTDPLLPDE